MHFYLFSQIWRMLYGPHLLSIALHFCTKQLPTVLGTRHTQSGSNLLLIGLLALLYSALPATASAQNATIQPYGDSPFTGNYCAATGGLSLQSTPYTGTFDIDVPGTPVAAYWFWSGRSHSQPHVGDETISIDHNGTGTVMLTAQQALSSVEPTFTWFTYAWDDADLSMVQSGSNSYTISDFNINGNYDENHGLSLVIIYADPACPYGETYVYFGLDSYRHTRPEEPYGPASEVLCLPVAPDAATRTMDFEVMVGGVLDETRNHAIWYDTGVGATPGTLVGESFATEIPDPFNNVPGPQWDMYSDQLTIQANDDYMCMQLESRKDDNGDSAVWVAMVTQVATEQMASNLGSIGDTVWYDDDADGIFDNTESGIPGVSMGLYDPRGTELARTVTNDNGFYTFTGLPAGDYTVVVDARTLSADPALQTYELDGTLDGNTTVTLATGQIRDDVDFGYQRLASIGDRVWNDLNGNGLQDGGEPGMAAITVNLLQNDTVIDSASTDADGLYGFDGLFPGSYQIQFVAPAAYETSPQNAGADDFDSDAAPSTGLSDLITLAPGANIDTVDAGFYQLIDLSLTKTSENDVVEAGSQNIFTIEVTNDGPSAATGVQVSDQLPSGLIYVTNMASHGSYDETSGIWTVGTLQVGETATLKLVTLVTETGIYTNAAEVIVANEPDKDSTPGNNDENEDDQDSDDVESTEPENPNNEPEIDLELLKLAEPVYLLVGENTTFMIELFNRGPDVATGVVVEDPLPEGLELVSASTSQGTYDESTGIWTVGTLEAGQNAVLTVVATVTQEGAFVNTAEVTEANENDKDSTPGNNDPREDGQSSATVGTIELGRLGDRVWLDTNANGLQDDGEAGFPGIFVTLYGADGTPLDAARTDESGGYLFADLRPGIYSIGFSLPQGLYGFSPQGVGDDETIDSDVNPANNRTAMIQLDEGVDDLMWDAGIYPQPLLAIEKTDHGIIAQPGSDIAYTLVYTNSGPGDAYNVVITEQVPEYTTLNVEASSPGWECDGASSAAGTFCHYYIGTVPAGTSGSLDLSFVITVDSPLPPEIDTILNTVRITHDDSENTRPGGQGEDVEDTPLIPTSLGEGQEPGVSASIFLPMISRE